LSPASCRINRWSVYWHWENESDS